MTAPQGTPLRDDPGPPAILMTDVGKTFGSTRALTSVSLRIDAGTVTALVGENGAGKSTALGILAGRIPASTGDIRVFGEPLRDGAPRASRRAGVVAIYQELTVIPALSAEANVFLADPLSRAGLLSERRMRRRYVELCDSLGVPVTPPRTPAGSLSVAEQQMVEILRAVVSDARIILFDEPTAALAVAEREALYRLVERLRREGVTMVFVSHNLDEVLQLADTVTVFRDGRVTARGPRSQFTKVSLVQAMLGSEVDSRLVSTMLEEAAPAPATTAAVPPTPGAAAAPPVLRVEGVTVPGSIADVDLEISAGEVVGVGGLVGSGRSTLLRAVAGMEATSTGRMWVDGTEVRWPRTVRRALGYGIALVPEDRKSAGLVPAMTAAENIALSDLGAAGRRGLLSTRGIERSVEEVAADFGFRRDRLRHRAWQLSGGNQQKLLMARWRHRRPRVLLADEPTRGIDVGAKSEILTSLEAMSAEGIGLAIVSSDLEEVAAFSDRIVVLAEGALVGALAATHGRRPTTSDILELAFRVSGATEDPLTPTGASRAH